MIRNANDLLRDAQRSLEQMTNARRDVYKAEIEFYRPILKEFGLAASVPEFEVKTNFGKNVTRYKYSAMSGKISRIVTTASEGSRWEELPEHCTPTEAYAACALAVQECLHKHLARQEGEMNALIKKLED